MKRIITLTTCIFIFFAVLLFNTTDPAFANMSLNFEYNDVVKHPVYPIFYATNKEEKRLYSINYSTGQVLFMTFELPPESLTFGNGEIYVSLLKGEHSSDWKDNLAGAIAIVDPVTFTKVDQFDIDTDPWDILVDREGYIYVLPGSGEFTDIKTYSRQFKTEVSSYPIRQQSYGEFHPVNNRLYTMQTSNQVGMLTYDIYLGNIGNAYEYSGYAVAPNFKISPDGIYVFNGAGTVFTSNADRMKDLKYAATLGQGFTDIAFDLVNYKFFTGLGKIITLYDYDNSAKFNQVGTYATQGDVKKLFFQNNRLIALTNREGTNLIEEIDPNSFLSGKKDMTSFSVAGVPGVIYENKISVTVPVSVNKKELIATFTSSVGSMVVIGDTIQISGRTKNDFTHPVTYTVVAQDDTTKNYIVNVYLENEIAPSGDVDLDGLITVDDSNLVSEHLSGIKPLTNFQLMSADVNWDGQVTEVDVQLILQYAEGLIDKYPVSNINSMPLRIAVTDTVMHPTKPILYLTSKVEKILYSINYQTREIASIKFNLQPESLTFGNNEIYVSLLKGEHSSYWWEENQQGAVAIIDADKFAIVDQFDIYTDPWDIVADRQGYIYTLSGSGQWTYLNSYSRATKASISSSMIRQQSYGEIHPTINKIYTINTDTSPRDMRAYNVSNGQFTDPLYPGGYDSPYHGDYPMAVNFKISPDGRYIFNGAGTVFSSNVNKAEDMMYLTSLDQSFVDIAFDLQRNRFYAAIPGNKISVYQAYGYESNPKFEQIGTYNTQGDVKILFFQNNKLIALTEKDGTNLIENVDLNSMLSNQKDLLSFSVAGVQGSFDSNKIFIKVPVQVYLTASVAKFESSAFSTVKVGDVIQYSEDTKNNFTRPVKYTVFASDGTSKDYIVTVYPEKGTISFGDVDFDGAVTEKDQLLTEEYVMGKISLANIQLMAADVNGDGKVTPVDAQLILQYTTGYRDEFSILKAKVIPLRFKVTDVVMHPTRPIVYITNSEDRRIYAIDNDKKEISFITFELLPESLTFENNEIYVSLLKGEHSSYWRVEEQKGAVAIINADSFVAVEQFDINTDPWDIVADIEGYIYVMSGSGQWTSIKSYSRATKTLVSSVNIRQQSYGEINPVYNVIHTIDSDLSPRDMSAYIISSGQFVGSIWPGGYDSPYHGEYPMAVNFDITPDGLFIFNGAGTIFWLDMTYITSMDQGFSDIAFNLEENEFFILNDNQVKVYDFEYLEQFSAHTIQGTPKKLFYQNEKLIIISQMNDGGYNLQTMEKDYAETQPGDFNTDGTVDASDLPAVAQSYGQDSQDYRFNPEMDTNKDRIVDLYDLVSMARKGKR